jgi:hypothetical protein
MIPTSDLSRTGRRSTSGLSRNEEMVRGCGIADPALRNVGAVRVRDTGYSESVSSAQGRNDSNFTLHNTRFDIIVPYFIRVVCLVLRTGNDFFPILL